MTNPHAYNQLTPKELHGWMQEGRDFILVDILIADHFRKIHLPHSKHACVFEVTFLEQVAAIAENINAEIVLYGSSIRSMDSIKAAEKLEQQGYSKINILKGGIEAWRAANLPLEGEAASEAEDSQTLLDLEDRTYLIDTDRSTVEWTGRNSNTSHFGTIRIIDGELAVKGSVLSGAFEIDMDSIVNINLEGDELQPVLIAHLKSDDFFHTSRFPRAKFTVLNSSRVREPFITTPNYNINGLLELKGVLENQNFMATVSKTIDNDLSIEAHFDIDRTKWGIIYGSARFFEHLGMHMVFDPISIQMRIIAT